EYRAANIGIGEDGCEQRLEDRGWRCNQIRIASKACSDLPENQSGDQKQPARRCNACARSKPRARSAGRRRLRKLGLDGAHWSYSERMRFSTAETKPLSASATAMTKTIHANMRAGSISSAASAMLRPTPDTEEIVSPPSTDAKQMKKPIRKPVRITGKAAGKSTCRN